MSEYPQTDQTRIRQHPERAHYDRATIHRILDEGLVCHVGFIHEDRPAVLPMSYARDGERLILHGGLKSRMLRALAGGAPLCVTVTIVDGLVVAASAMHHSMNYRSVVIHGHARELPDDEKPAAMRCLVTHYLPEHLDQAREPTTAELAATAVLELPLTEVSAKIRTGPPTGNDTSVWTGEIPLHVASLQPVASPGHPTPSAMPPSIGEYSRPGIQNLHRR